MINVDGLTKRDAFLLSLILIGQREEAKHVRTPEEAKARVEEIDADLAAIKAKFE